MEFGVRGIGGEIKLFPPPTYHGELDKWDNWSWQLKIYVGLYKPLAKTLMDEVELNAQKVEEGQQEGNQEDWSQDAEWYGDEWSSWDDYDWSQEWIGSLDDWIRMQPDGQPVDKETAKCFRSRVGKALYLSFDRPDVQHAVRELTKEMKEPTVIRHLETKSLWVQKGLKEKKFQLMAVDTQNNAADIHTKGMNAERFVMLRTMLGVISNDPGQMAMRAEIAKEMFNSIKRKATTTSAKKLAAAIFVSQVPGAWGTSVTTWGGRDLDVPAEGGHFLRMAAAMMAVMIAPVWWCCRAKGKVDLKKDATTQTEAPHLSACVPNQRLQDMYLTPQGERIHLDDDCPYIRAATP
eukprot:s11402_g1.t1